MKVKCYLNVDNTFNIGDVCSAKFDYDNRKNQSVVAVYIPLTNNKIVMQMPYDFFDSHFIIL